MDHVKSVIIAFLILALLLSGGLPLFRLNDANLDRRVNLEDLILHTRDFTRTAEDPSFFDFTTKKLISTIQIVAELETELTARQEVPSRSLSYVFSSIFLMNSSLQNIPDGYFSVIIEDALLFQSITINLDTPPPKLRLRAC